MPVAFEGYEGKAIEAVIALLVGSTTFATLAAVPGPGTAADRIIEIDGGAEDETTPLITATSGATFARATAPCWAHIWPEAPELSRTWLAENSRAGSGIMPIALYLRPASSITLRHERLRWALSKTSLIRGEIEAQAGSVATTWRRNTCAIVGLQFLDLAGHARGLIRTALQLSYGDLP